MTVGDSALKKARRRILPLLVLCYFFAYLDRANVSIGALQINADLGFSPTTFAIGGGIFFLGFSLFEIPSNWALNKVGARIWIARIMLTWGILATATIFINDARSFYFIRFFLGAAEAGFFPGVVLYLSRWFPARDRTAIMAIFILGFPLSYILGSPLSGALLDLDGVLNIRGWKWMFLCEGIPTIVLGVVCFAFLVDKPADAKWLEPVEREWLTQMIKGESAALSAGRSASFVSAFLQPEVWLLGVAYVGIIMGTYGLGLWLPQIVKPFGYGNFGTGVISAIPYVFGAPLMVIWSRHSDRQNERRWHAILPCVLACSCLILSSLVKNQVMSFVFLIIVAVGILASHATFWAIPTTTLTGAAAASGIAIVSSIGNVGGFAGPYLVGYVREITGNFGLGMYFLAIGPFLSAAILFFVTGRMSAARETILLDKSTAKETHI